MDTIIADLHTHSNFSDGTFSPEGLVSLAKLRGLSVIAVTDHDTTDGIDLAIKAGKYYGVEVIAGVELSCEYNGVEIHVLGYFIDTTSSELQSLLNQQKLYRRERMGEIISRLNKDGIKLSLENVTSYAKGGVVGRPHLASVLIKQGYAKNLQDVYKRFIGKHCPYYVPTRRLKISEAIEIIRSSSGLPVLAHPIFVPEELLIELLENFAFWGIETYYPEHSVRFISYLESLAQQFSLVKTGGSDFHGSAKKEDFLGKIGLKQAQLKPLLERLNNYVPVGY